MTNVGVVVLSSSINQKMFAEAFDLILRLVSARDRFRLVTPWGQLIN